MVEIRFCADETDEAASLEVWNRVYPWDAITMDEVLSWKQNMIATADYLAVLDGARVGSLAACRMPQKPDIGLMMLTVLPDYRGRGAGTALYRAGSEWLAAQGMTETEALAPEDDAASIAWAERRGFGEVQRNGRMVLELGAIDPLPVEPPPGIEIVTWAERPELARGVYEVAAESVADIPGDEDYVIEPYERWLTHHLRGSGDRADATFLALAGDEVAAYAKLSFTAARPTAPAHDLTAVKRAWRGKGIAGALKRAQIAWAKEQGYERLTTTNEVRNEPIRRLNERLGYRPAPGRLVLRGPLSPA